MLLSKFHVSDTQFRTTTKPQALVTATWFWFLPRREEPPNRLLASSPALRTLVAAVPPPAGQQTDDFWRDGFDQCLPCLGVGRPGNRNRQSHVAGDAISLQKKNGLVRR